MDRLGQTLCEEGYEDKGLVPGIDISVEARKYFGKGNVVVVKESETEHTEKYRWYFKASS